MNPIIPIEYLAAIGLLLAAGVLAAAWRSTRRLAGRLRVAVLLLRIAMLALVALVALNPGRWRMPSLAVQREFALLLDRSASMGTADADGSSRWTAALKTATAARGNADENIPLRIHTFGGILEDAVDPAALGALKPDLPATDLAAAGDALLDRYQGGAVELAGIIVISDGRQTAPPGRLDEFALRAVARRIPVNTVPLGGPVPVRDLVVEADRMQSVAFAGQKARLAVALSNRGLGRINPDVTLWSAGSAVSTVRAMLDETASTQVVFEVTAPAAGYYNYRFTASIMPGESQPGNNEADTGLAVLSQPIRVFLLEGTPYWDSKFLAQLLRLQSNVVMTAVYRLSADRYFRIEGTNASFVAQGAGPFPATAAQLGRYDVIVLGKGLEYVLDRVAIDRLKEFLRDNGGAVVFARGKPYHGRFEPLEPIESVEWGPAFDGSFNWKPARSGAGSSFFSGALLPSDDALWSQLIHKGRINECRRLRSFATALIESARPGTEQAIPALVSSRYGKGLVATVNADGLWNWDFRATDSPAKQFYRRFWAQLVQWAATGGEFLPGHDVSMRLVQNRAAPGDPVGVIVVARSDDRGPAAPGRVRIAQGARIVAEVPLAQTSRERARWDGALALDVPGRYRVELIVPPDAATPLAFETLTVAAPPAESDDYSADRPALEALSKKTGGAVVASGDAAGLKRCLAAPSAEAKVEAGTGVWESRWDRWWLLLLLVTLPAAEWYVRRRNGLM